MATASLPAKAPALARPLSPLGGLLSYLVPGLGQIVQGRVGKGVLFLVCLYGLFFYGMYLGDWQNVYVPQSSPAVARDSRNTLGRMLDWFIDRARFLGQAGIGAAAWPAIIQHLSAPGDPAFADGEVGEPRRKGHPLLGNFMRLPDEEETNRLLRDSDKKPDLGWMYTVIAGVLNILVIYDAFAGPAFGAAAAKPAAPKPDEAPALEKATP